jgi:hypothetical protein
LRTKTNKRKKIIIRKKKEVLVVLHALWGSCASRQLTSRLTQVQMQTLPRSNKRKKINLWSGTVCNSQGRQPWSRLPAGTGGLVVNFFFFLLFFFFFFFFGTCKFQGLGSSHGWGDFLSFLLVFFWWTADRFGGLDGWHDFDWFILPITPCN